jgi:hypothetical protein
VPIWHLWMWGSRVNGRRGKPPHLRLQPHVVILAVAKIRHRFRLRLHTLLTPFLPSSLLSFPSFPFLSFASVCPFCCADPEAYRPRRG